MLIPAGYVRTVYDPTWVLSPDKRRYVATNRAHLSPLSVREALKNVGDPLTPPAAGD